MSTQGRIPLDYSKVIRRKLAEGNTLEEALVDLRAADASMFDCIVSVRSVYSCTIQEAKQMVASSAALHDVVSATEAEFRECGVDEDAEV
jgi:ribosomal protein L7/L12